MRWTSIALGAMALAVLDAVLSHAGAASNVGGWLSSAGNLVNRFLDPAVPFFSTTSTSSSVAPTASTSASSGTLTPSNVPQTSQPTTAAPGGITIPPGTVITSA